MERKFALNDRLVNFSIVVLKISQRFPKIPAASHIADQIARSGSAPALHYAEAQGAESPKDFIHKMKVAIKELRETFNALRIAKQMCWLPEEEFE
jgi:four helix bundle protein